MSITRNAKALSLLMLVSCSTGATFATDKKNAEPVKLDAKTEFVWKHFGFDSKEAHPYKTKMAYVGDTADIWMPTLFGIMGLICSGLKAKEIHSNTPRTGKMWKFAETWNRLQFLDTFGDNYSVGALIAKLAKKSDGRTERLSQNTTTALGALAGVTGGAAGAYGMVWLAKKLSGYVSQKVQFNKELINFLINWRNGARYENKTPGNLHKTFNEAQAALIEDLKSAEKEYKDLDAAKDHKLVAKISSKVKTAIEQHLAKIRAPQEA